MSRHAATSIAAATAFASILVAHPVIGAEPGAPAPTVEVADDHVVVVVHGLRNDHGSVHCVLYNGAAQFPEGTRNRVAITTAHPSGGAARCSFEGVSRGHDFAVVIHHDENNDGTFQRGAFGIPLEGYGFSNDARVFLSAPSFDACHFRFTGGTSTLRITARY